MTASTAFDIETQWVHIQFRENLAFNETYGFAGNQGHINLEGIFLRPAGRPSKTLVIFMHPASTLHLLPVPRALAQAGVHVLCAASRYAKNDTALIMEKVALDLGAFIRHAKQELGYEKIVLGGWSGGGSLALFYQSQAEAPTITHTPAGDPVDLTRAELIPADGVVLQAAHLSRADSLTEIIDPSVTDELHPENRELELDIYDARNPNQPPYSAEFMTRYRAAQLARVRRITAWVKQELARLAASGTGEVERGFVVHRTMADPRYLDPALDPNDRRPGWCFMGNPATVNNGPVGLARFCTLRSWLSQWSIDDSHATGVACAKSIRAALLVIENSADDAVPQPHARMIYEAAASSDKTMQVIQGATHYYQGQPEQLQEATQVVHTWLQSRALLD